MDVAGLVKVKVQADLSELGPGFDRARGMAGAFDKEASRAFRGVDKSVRETGRSVRGMATEFSAANDNIRGGAARAAMGIDELRARALALGAALAVAFGAIQPIFAFQDAVAEVSTLVDTAVFDMSRLEASALAMAAAFGGGAVAQVKAFNDVISAGTEDLARASQIVTAANKLAIGGASSVTIATDGLTNILNAYGDKVSDVTAISDAMLIAMRDGKTTVAELASTLGKVAPIAAQTNVSFDELTAAIAALTLGGISTAESVTGVRAMLAAIAKPTSQAAELAKKLGIEFNVTGLQAKGLVGFLDELMAKTGGSTDQLAILFGGVEALVPAMALAGSAGDSFGKTMDNMAGKAGATEAAFNKMADSPGFQAGRMWSALQAEVIGAGGALDALVPLMRAVADHMDIIVAAAVIFTAGHLAAAIVPVIVQVTALAASMGTAALAARGLALAMAFFGGPVGIAVTALAGAYLLLRDNVSAAEQATRDAKSAFDLNEQALNDSKAASEGYTVALRNQIAMQVEAARASNTEAQAAFFAASARRSAFESMTGLRFAPLVYAEKVADQEATAMSEALAKLEDQLAQVDANVQKTATSTGSLNSALTDTSGSEKAANAYKRIVQSAQEFIDMQALEREALGMTEQEANRLRYEQELLNAAQQAGITLTAGQRAELGGLAAAMAATEEAARRSREQLSFTRDLFGGFISDFKQGLMDGKSFWESLGSAGINALGKIADKLMDEVLSAILKVNSAASGGGLFGLFGKLFGGFFGGGFTDTDYLVDAVMPWAKGGAFDRGNVIPFANGAAFTNSIVDRPTMFPMAGGTGLMGEAGPEAIMPLRRGPDGKLGVQAANQNGGGDAYNVPINITIDATGADGAGLRRVEQQVAQLKAELPGIAVNAIIGARKRNVKV